MLAAICYPHTALPEDQVLGAGAAPRRPTSGSRCCAPTWASGTTAATSPGRAFERTGYRFDVLADYGAFRDLQRHRMLTIEWQALSPRHGYEVPDAVEEAGLADAFDEAMDRSAALHDALRATVPRAGVVRGGARVPGAVRDADERARGDAPARAAHRRRRATPRTGRCARRCTG